MESSIIFFRMLSQKTERQGLRGLDPAQQQIGSSEEQMHITLFLMMMKMNGLLL